MKIVVLGLRGFPGVQGGVETHCEHLYPRLARKGLDITVCTRRQYMPDPLKEEWNGIKFVHLQCPMKKNTETIVHTAIAVLKAKKLGTKAIHIHSIGPSLLVPLAKLMGLKVIMTHHGPDYERAKWNFFAKAVLRFGEKLGCRYSDRVIAISSTIKNSIRKKFDKEAVLIPNGVEIPTITKKTTYIDSLGLKSNKYILAVARFVPEKGLHDLIEAFSRIETDWKLVIAGDADHETPYSKHLKLQAKGVDKVILTGFSKGSELNEIYSHAGLFVLPSYHEGLPISLLEALSYGLSVLVSDIEPHKEIALDSKRYFSMGDIGSLSQKMLFWIERGTLKPQEQSKQIKMVKQKYNWDNIAEKVAQVYSQVLELDHS